MTTSVPQTAHRVEALDLLRLVAVVAVIFYHYGFWGPESHGVAQVAIPSLAKGAQYGFLGVPIFFIISGFVIAYSAEGRTASGFAIARISRIYPTFLLCMTLTFLVLMLFGGPHYAATVREWLANLCIAAPALGQPYMDGVYWSLVIEVAFYAWVAVFIAFGLFPRRMDVIILVWLGLTFANELTIDAPIFEKVFLADDSGFFAVGLLIYAFYRGRRDAALYALMVLSVGTSVFQAVHKLGRLSLHGGSTFEQWVVVAICLASIALVVLAINIRRLPLSAHLVAGLGGMTYPLYLLHMQIGYTLFAWAAPAHGAIFVVSMMLGIAGLSWFIWRFVEPPLQRWTKKALAAEAARWGWALKSAAPLPEK